MTGLLRCQVVLSVLICCALGGVADIARAQPETATPAAPSQSAVEQAKALFKAGVQAYDLGRYAAAAQAFEEAYKLVPRPPLLFSLAQARRRQHAVDGGSGPLQAAIKAYREYLSLVPQGGRRADAAQALSELEVIAARLSSEEEVASPAEEEAAPQVMITSSTPGAVVTIDGNKLGKQPYFGELPAGRHQVVVQAPGFFDEKRDIVAPERGVLALDISLREKPARLDVAAPRGAQIFVDGRLAGTAPLPKVLELPPGRHLVTVEQKGTNGWAQELDLKRGQTRLVQTDLKASAQRRVARGLVFSGGAVMAAGVGLALVASHFDSEASQILDDSTDRNLTENEREDYESSRTARDGLRQAATTTLLGGSLLALSGAALWLFESPRAPRASPFKDRPSQKTGLVVSPALSSSFFGAQMAGRF